MRKIVLSVLTFLAAGLLVIAIIVPDRNKMEQNEQNIKPDTQQASSDSKESTAEDSYDGAVEAEEDFFDDEDLHGGMSEDAPAGNSSDSSEPPNGVYIPDENTSGSETNTDNTSEGSESDNTGPGGEFETEEDPL